MYRCDVVANGPDRLVGHAARTDTQRELPVAELPRGLARESEHGRGISRDRHHRDARWKAARAGPRDAHRDRVVVRPGIRPEALVSEPFRVRAEIAKLSGRETEPGIETDADFHRAHC